MSEKFSNGTLNHKQTKKEKKEKRKVFIVEIDSLTKVWGSSWIDTAHLSFLLTHLGWKLWQILTNFSSIDKI